MGAVTTGGFLLPPASFPRIPKPILLGWVLSIEKAPVLA